MSDATQVRQLVARSVEQFGRLDCVVNNAATPLRVGVTNFDDALWHKAMDVNVWGPIRLIHECLPHLRQSDSATVINVLSVGGLRGSMSLLGYGSAKAALRPRDRVDRRRVGALRDPSQRHRAGPVRDDDDEYQRWNIPVRRCRANVVETHGRPG